MVISDSTETGAANRERFLKVAPEFSDRLKYLELFDLSTEELLGKLAHLPPDAIILNLSFFRDRLGKSYSTQDGNRLIATNSGRPIYSCWDFYLVGDVVGGYVTSGLQQGEAAATMAAAILKGIRADDIPIMRNSPNVYMFDYNVMERFRIKESALPKGSIVLNRKLSAWEQYWDWFLGIVVIGGFQTFLILALWTRGKRLRAANAAVHESEEAFRKLFEDSSNPILLMDGERFTACNQATIQFLGLADKAAFLSSTPEDISPRFQPDGTLSSESAPKYMAQAHREGFCRFEWQCLRSDQTPFLLEVTLIPMTIGGKRLLHVTWLDITERKQAEEALRHSEQKYKSILENIQDVFYRTNAQGLVEIASPSALTVLGYDSMDEIVGRPAASFYSNPCDRERLLADLDCQGRVSDYEIEMVKRDGTAITVSTSSNYYYDQGGNLLGIEGVLRDVSERKRAKLALEEMNRSLEAQVRERTRALEARSVELEEAYSRLMDVDRLKSALLSTVSHDLRTPLTSILGFAKLIRRDFQKYFLPAPGLQDKTSRINEDLSIIIAEGERLTRLINDLLDLSRIEANRMEWRDQAIDPAELLANAAKTVNGEFMAKPDVALVTEAAQGLPLLFVDPDRIAQVLINLLHNAIKFTDKGRVTLRALPSDGSVVHILVEDTGIGMHQEEQVKVFDKFYKIDRGDTGNFAARGSGLGLAICKEIVQHYNGRIWAESVLGQGSVFHLELPVARTVAKELA